MRGRQVKALDLVKDHREEIESLYETGESHHDIAKKFNCSPNTMMIALGVMGYPYQNWAKKQVASKLAKLERDKLKRIKTNRQVYG